MGQMDELYFLHISHLSYRAKVLSICKEKAPSKGYENNVECGSKLSQYWFDDPLLKKKFYKHMSLQVLLSILENMSMFFWRL